MFNGVKVNIRGQQEGTSGYNAVLDRHRGAIQQFLNAQQQQVLLSGNTQYTTRASFEGAYATYSNNNGQEYLDIEVTVPLTKVNGESEQRPSGQPWEFALVEFTVTGAAAELRSDMAAFLAKPLIPTVKAINSGSSLPINGVSEDSYYAVNETDILKFAAQDTKPMVGGVTNRNDRIFSLHVDMRKFPFQTISIDIYAYAQSVEYVVGGDGFDGGRTGEFVSAERYGSLTKDILPLVGTAFTPGGLASTPNKLFLDVGKNSLAFRDALYRTFPSLSGVPYEYLGTGDGFESMGLSFHTAPPTNPGNATSPTNTATWTNNTYISGNFSPVPSSISPNTDPNAWTWRSLWTGLWLGNFNNMAVTDYWAPGSPRTISVDNSVKLSPLGGTATISTYEDPATFAQSAQVYNAYKIQYFVPTWKYTNRSNVTITGVCCQAGDPWNAWAQYHIVTASGGGEYSYTWERKQLFPKRPPMAQLKGTFELPNVVRGGDVSPNNHFGLTIMGRLIIDTSTGGIKFVAA